MACRGDGEFPTKKDRPFPCRSLPPDIHFKMCKKVAQLTKVIYSLNIRLDEQNAVIEEVKGACEDRVRQLLADTRQKLSGYKAKAELANKLERTVGDCELALEREQRRNAELERDMTNLRERWKKDLREKEEYVHLLKLSEDKRNYFQPGKSNDSSRTYSAVDVIPEKDVHHVLQHVLNDTRGNGFVKEDNCGVSSTIDITATKRNNLSSEVEESKNHICQMRLQSLEKILAGKKQENVLLHEKINLLEMELLQYKDLVKPSQEADIMEYEATVRELQDRIFQLQTVLEQYRPEQDDVGTQTEPAEGDQAVWQHCCEAKVAVDRTVVECSILHLREDLLNTVRELQSVGQMLKDTKEELKNTQEKFNCQEQTAPTATHFVLDKETGPNCLNGTGKSSIASVKGGAKVELREKVAELLQYVSLLDTESQENLSDAEKCGEAKLKEVQAHYEHLMSTSEENYQQLLREKEALDCELMVQREKYSESETLWEEERTLCATNGRAELEELRAKMEQEKSDLLAAHVAQHAEETNELRERLELLKGELRQKEATSIHRECLLMQEVEDERDKGEVFAEKSQTLQAQLELALRELEQKREEVLRVRKESNQQIRNLENYWLEKVNHEMEKAKKNLVDEKLAMTESFFRQQQLLKNKIIVLQAQNRKNTGNGYAKVPLLATKDAPRFRQGFDAAVSQSQLPTHIYGEVNSLDRHPKRERRSASQPNVSALAKERSEDSKEKERSRKVPEHKFIRRAESVLLPKLQFLSFWKSVDKLPRTRSTSNGLSVFRALMGDSAYDQLRSSSSCCNLSNDEPRTSGKRQSANLDNWETPFLEEAEDEDDQDLVQFKTKSVLESEL